jgi:quinol monooxygenase YgiN
MTGGAVLWGAMAARWGVPAALLSASAGALIAMFITWRLTLGGEDGLARSAPARLMRAPGHDDIPPERGPVAVHVEYRIAQDDAGGFIAAAQGMERIRRRDGALSWGLFEDPDAPGRYVETFVVESWAEHLRQHHRGTADDAPLFERVRAFHRGDGPPQVTHWIAVNASAATDSELV